MNKLGFVILSFLILTNTYAEDKLKTLDKQTLSFFKEITGLEKDYISEQVKNIEKTNVRVVKSFKDKEFNQSEEEYERDSFVSENAIARIKADFTRTKKLKDIQIKSMYNFEGINYVVLNLENSSRSSLRDKEEQSLQIEGRYKVGDYILTHKIVSINRRTKTVELYKDLNKKYYYYIYLSNYGISVGKLKKKKMSLKNNFTSKSISKKSKVLKECRYEVLVEKLNVRDYSYFDAKILKQLSLKDSFTVLKEKNKWLQIKKIYIKSTNKVINVENSSNWVQLNNKNIKLEDNNCIKE